MVGIVVLGLVLSRVLGHTNPHVTEARAVAIGRPKVDFKPDGHTIRLVRRGIPPRPYWIVSYWTRRAGGGYGRITVVLVNATDGHVAEVRKAR